MDEEDTKRPNSLTPGTYEYEKRKALRNDYGMDFNQWGVRVRATKQEAHEFMLGRMPGLNMYRIPRELAARIDITPTAKLVYGMLLGFCQPFLRLYLSEIAGLCGLDTSAVSSAMHDLEHHGYISIKPTYFSKNRRGPSIYYIHQLGNARNKNSIIPSIMKTDTENIEERIRERFYDA